MATSFLPSTQRIPAAYQRVIYQNTPGLLQLGRAIVLVGYRLASMPATFDEEMEEVRSRSDVQKIAGVGSILDLAMKEVLDSADFVAAAGGSLPSVFIVPVAPPIGPFVATQYTLTVSGAPTTNGSLTVDVHGVTMLVAVGEADTTDEITARMDATAQGRETDLPVTSSSALSVATFVANHIGELGNDIYVGVDTTNAPGVTVTVAQSVAGTGVVDMAPALAATLNPDIRLGAVVVLQSDTQTSTDLEAHVRSAWTPIGDAPRIGLLPKDGDLSDAQTEAIAIDYLNTLVCSNEKVAGVGTPFDRKSGHTMVTTMTAAYAAKLLSQDRPSYNHNRGPLPGDARRGLTNAELNDAILGGVSVFGERNGTAIIWDPISSALTDQTGVGSGPNTEWQPIEIALTTRAIWEQMRFILDRYAQEAGTEFVRNKAVSSALSVLRDAAANNWIQPVPDGSVTAAYVVVGATTRLVMDIRYTPIRGIDIVEITHYVTLED